MFPVPFMLTLRKTRMTDVYVVHCVINVLSQGRKNFWLSSCCKQKGCVKHSLDVRRASLSGHEGVQNASQASHRMTFQGHDRIVVGNMPGLSTRMSHTRTLL